MRASVASIQSRISRSATAALRRLAAARTRDPIFWLVATGCLLIAGICAGTTIMVGEFRERALSNNERELENTVMLLTRHFEQQFDDSETVTAEVISQMHVSGVSTPEAFKEKMSTPEAHQILQSKVSALSYIGDVAIFDADGLLINWSRDYPLPVINVVDRPYFKTFKTDPQANAVLAEPARSYLDGSWTTIVAHRLNAPDGTLLGVMSRRIDPANYERFFASLSLGGGAAISMLHSDGTMLARYPHVEALIVHRPGSWSPPRRCPLR